MSKTKPSKPPLLPLRTAVVFLTATLIATPAGGLTYFSGTHSLAAAIIAAGTAFAAAVVWLDKIIAP